MKYEYATYTDKGSRENNEDSIVVRESEGRLLLVVADGLGGLDCGEVASKIACDTAARLFEKMEEVNEANLESMIKSCDMDICEYQNGNPECEKMRTTFSMVVCANKKVYRSHVGDSRVYRFFKSGKYEHTLDHSVPQELVSAGELKESEIRNHVDRNKLVKVLGNEEADIKPVVDAPVKAVKWDAYLICSDGFWELITEKEMNKCLYWAKTPQQWLDKMIEIVHKNGEGKDCDNCSAITLFIR